MRDCLPCTPCSPGSLYVATIVDVTPGDTVAFTSKRVDVIRYKENIKMPSEDEETHLWDEKIGPNQKYDGWDFIHKWAGKTKNVYIIKRK